jgi:hypothetical protein
MVLFTGMIGFFVLICVFYFCCDCVYYCLRFILGFSRRIKEDISLSHGLFC